MTGPAIVFRPAAELVPYARNAKKHPPEQIADLRRSLVEYGWTMPALIDEADGLVAGHGRIEAAGELYAEGVELRFVDGTPIPLGSIPTITARGWSDEKRRAYVIADNKLPEGGAWDAKLLALELGDLEGLGALPLSFFGEQEFAALLAPPGPNDVRGEWKGMPEFEQKDKTAFRTLPVHFKDQAAVDAFASLVGQKITPKTRFLWFPEIEIETYADKAYRAPPP